MAMQWLVLSSENSLMRVCDLDNGQPSTFYVTIGGFS